MPGVALAPEPPLPKVQLRPRNSVGSVLVVVVGAGATPAKAIPATSTMGRASKVDFIARTPVGGKTGLNAPLIHHGSAAAKFALPPRQRIAGAAAGVRPRGAGWRSSP